MNPTAFDERASRAKSLFEFLMGWNAPALPGMTSESVRLAMTAGGEPVVLGVVTNIVSREEREALRELNAYRRTIYNCSQMIDGGHGNKERVFANLYDALFAHLRIFGEMGTRLLRGQRDSRWPLQASYYRALLNAPRNHDDEEAVVSSFYGVHVIPFDEMSDGERGVITAHFQQKYPQVSLVGLTGLQQEAIIQHYLSGSKLLDFTTSIYVAAFFATTSFSVYHNESRPEMGAIYNIGNSDLAGLAMGRVYAPELPERFLRIHRQKGVFLTIRFREAINQPGLWMRWVFRHSNVAYPFRCPHRAITVEDLLPDEIAE